MCVSSSAEELIQEAVVLPICTRIPPRESGIQKNPFGVFCKCSFSETEYKYFEGEHVDPDEHSTNREEPKGQNVVAPWQGSLTRVGHVAATRVAPQQEGAA